MKRLLILFLLPIALNARNAQVDVGVGYRIDSLFIEQELPYFILPVETSTRWDDLEIWEVIGRADLEVACNFYIGATGKVGWINRGHLKIEDRLTEEPHDVYVQAGGSDVSGEVYNARAHLGYRVYSCCNSLMIAPIVGYAYDHNHYSATNVGWGPEPDMSEELFPLSSTLTNDYHGPYVGFEATFDLCFTRLFGALHYDWMWYSGTSRDDYSYSFIDLSVLERTRNSKNEAFTHGPVVQVGLDSTICDNYYLGVLFEYRYTNSTRADGSFVDTQVMVDPDGGTENYEDRISPHINHIQWDNWSIQLHAGVCF